MEWPWVFAMAEPGTVSLDYSRLYKAVVCFDKSPKSKAFCIPPGIVDFVLCILALDALPASIFINGVFDRTLNWQFFRQSI